MPDVAMFADSWNTEENCEPCWDCRVDVCAKHPETTQEEAKKECAIFRDGNGNYNQK